MLSSLSLSQCFVPAYFVVTELVTDGTFSIPSLSDVLSRIIKFTVTGFITHSPYYPQITHITTSKLIATIIHRLVSFSVVP